MAPLRCAGVGAILWAGAAICCNRALSFEQVSLSAGPNLTTLTRLYALPAPVRRLLTGGAMHCGETVNTRPTSRARRGGAITVKTFRYFGQETSLRGSRNLRDF